MVKVNFIINKGVTMMDNGKIIKCMDLEDYFMRMDTQLIKVNGILINSMVQVKFIMIIVQKIKKNLITQILPIQISNGNTIREVLFLIQNKDLEKQFQETRSIMKEVLVEIDLMDRVNSTKKMDKLFMEYGKIQFLKKYYDIVSIK